ncbi:unnamed protein product [marine sediment metagenome]|uniref:CoA-binding domain-containing protein n=1 Tax=marine sediment metagenome TaxID=412755 RepID=X1LM95_9ZZZZ
MAARLKGFTQVVMRTGKVAARKALPMRAGLNILYPSPPNICLPTIIAKLKQEIRHILGLDSTWGIAIVGIGNLGAALLTYPGFKREEFEIRAAFDRDESKIEKVWRGIKVQHVDKIPKVLSERQIKIGVITTPATAAQEVADKLAKGGVKGILNFAPVRISVPKEIRLKNVDLSMQLETLSYFLRKST